MRRCRLVCGRFTSSQRREAFRERFEIAVPDTYRERYNLAPQQGTLIVREREDAGEATMAKWGLLLHWAKDPKVAFKMINARAETLSEKPAYRSLLSRYRCLIPADGFYEWTVGSDGKKHPIHFHLPEYELFAFAGLWTSRTDDESGEIIESCTIITTRPNELVASVHDRMPVILPLAAESVWLGPAVSREHALSLLEPYPADLMAALPASTRANSIRNDDSGLLLLCRARSAPVIRQQRGPHRSHPRLTREGAGRRRDRGCSRGAGRRIAPGADRAARRSTTRFR